MKRTSLLLLIILAPAVLFAQTPPPGQTPPATPPRQAAQPAAPAVVPAGGSKVAVIDVQRAIAENANGKKAIAELNSFGQKKQSELEGLQKKIDEMTNRLKTGAGVMNDESKVTLQRQIDRDTTQLQRDTDDAQKALQDLQNKLLAPIYQLTQKVLEQYATEMGFAVVFDSSSQASSIVHVDPIADITTEIIRRIDAEIAKTPKPAEPTKKQ